MERRDFVKDCVFGLLGLTIAQAGAKITTQTKAKPVYQECQSGSGIWPLYSGDYMTISEPHHG